MKRIPAILIWGAFLLYLWPRMFFVTPEGIYTQSRTVWGDWAAHLTYANIFAYQDPMNWFKHNPIFHGSSFNYPFVTSMISGLLIRSGVSLIDSFMLPSIVFSLLLLVCLGRFFSNYFDSSRKTIIAFTLFFLSGGLGFFYSALTSDHLFNFLRSIFQNSADFSLDFNKNFNFGNFLLFELIPQRAILLGIPFSLFVLIKLKKWVDSGFINVSKCKMVLLGIAIGLLPNIHAHSLIAVSIFLAVILVLNIRYIVEFIIIGLPALALICVWYFSFLYNSLNATRFEQIAGWYAQESQQNYFYFWFLNLGFFLPLAMLGTFQKKLFTDPFIVSGWCLFLIGNLVKLQPWIWDNMKVFTYSYLFLIPAVVQALSYLWNFGRWPLKLTTALLGISLAFSGGIDVARHSYFNPSWLQMFSSQDLEIASKFRDISTPTDIVLTSDNHLHWVPCLTGRRILMGFKGWLWSYGINYTERENDIKTMYSGTSEGFELLQKYKVRFIVFDSFDSKLPPSILETFKQKAALALQDGRYFVFENKF